MTPRDAVQEIKARAEKLSGSRMLCEESADLKVDATVRIARPGDPAHILHYRPQSRPALDYVLAFQYGFVIRHFSVPEADRWALASTPGSGQKAKEMVQAQLGSGPTPTALPPEVVAAVADQILTGVISQLRSVAIGMRIDSWLRSDYPALEEQQDRMARRQLSENLGALSPAVRTFTPGAILAASLGINAAFASYWAGAWSDTTVLSAWRASGHLATGVALLRLMNALPDDPAQDRKLVDAWGRHLSLDGWHQFVAPA